MKNFLKPRFNFIHIVLLGIVVACTSKIQLNTVVGGIETLNFKEVQRPLYVPFGNLNIQQNDITVLYRLSSGEVGKISPKGQSFSEANSLFWGVLVNPTFTDDMQERPFRQLGAAKTAIPGTNTVRNATSAEITNFPIFDDDDNKQEHADGVTRRLANDREFRIFARALVRLLVQEFNRSRTVDGVNSLTIAQAWNALKNEVDKNEATN